MLTKVIRWIWQGVKLPFRMLWEWLKAGIIDFRKLTLSQALLAILGYAATLLLLFFVLVPTPILSRPGAVAIEYSGKPVTVPSAVVIVVMITFGLGWAYVLTGITDCSKRVFFPVMLLFVVQLLMQLPFQNQQYALLVCASAILSLAVPATASLVYLFFRKKRFLTEYPLVEFLLWFGVAMFFPLLSLLLAPLDYYAGSLSANFSVIILLSFVFWVIAALAAVDAAASLASGVSSWLRYLFPVHLLPGLQAVFVLALPMLMFVLMMLAAAFEWKEGGAFGFIGVIPAGLAMLVMFFLILIRRWNERNAAVVMAASFASPVIALGFSNIDASNLLGTALETANVLPRSLLFVALMAYNVFSAGSSFVNIDGRHVPRSGRVLLLFGFALLVIGGTVFFMNMIDANGIPDESFSPAISALFMLTLVFLGPFYLAWIAWKHPERLVGTQRPEKPLFSVLQNLRGLRWAAVVGGLTILMTLCLSCLCIVFVSMIPNK